MFCRAHEIAILANVSLIGLSGHTSRTTHRSPPFTIRTSQLCTRIGRVRRYSGVRSAPSGLQSRGAKMTATDHDWTTPSAMAIPPEGYFTEERGRYGPVYPRTPACHGFSIIAKVKEGREDVVRAYGKTIEETIAASPEALAPLKLHYLRWNLFDVGSGLHFQYMGIFDTDFDKYTEDAVQ